MRNTRGPLGALALIGLMLSLPMICLAEETGLPNGLYLECSGKASKDGVVVDVELLPFRLVVALDQSWIYLNGQKIETDTTPKWRNKIQHSYSVKKGDGQVDVLLFDMPTLSVYRTVKATGKGELYHCAEFAHPLKSE